MKSPKQILDDTLNNNSSVDVYCLYGLRDTGVFEYLLDIERPKEDAAIEKVAHNVAALVLDSWVFDEWKRPEHLEEMAVKFWPSNELLCALDNGIFEFSVNALALTYNRLKLEDDFVCAYMKSQDNYEKLPQPIKDEIEDWLIKNPDENEGKCCILRA